MMHSTAAQPQYAPEFGALKQRLKATWMTGNYDVFSRFMQKGAEQFHDRLAVAPGTRLLDVACGAGQLALIAARRGAQATGCDIATNWLDLAAARAAKECLAVTFDEADAEDLPYPDGAFDTVASVVGAMFAPRPERVAAEMTRVCRSGGTIAMVNWTAAGFVGQMFRIIARHIAPPGMASPLLWGEEETVRARFQDGIARIRCDRRMYPFDYPFPPAQVVEFFRVHYGPMTRAFAALEPASQHHLREELVRLWEDHNTAGGGTTHVDAESLELIATRA